MPHNPPDDYARLLSIFDAIVSALIVVDSDRVIRDANTAARIALGDGCVGTPYTAFFRFKNLDPIAECLRSGEGQHRVESRGEDERVWGVTASPLALPGQAGGAVVGFRDLTELKKIEDVLATSERQAIVGRLAATVAHEVNNPLGAIKAHLRLMKKQLADKPEIHKSLDTVSDQVDRIARIIQLLLGFSRQRSAPEHTVALSDVIGTVLDLFDGGFQEKGIKVKTLLPEVIPAILADTDQVQEVLVNLLENARAALSSGSCLAVTLLVHASEIEIRFEDDGPGLGDDPEKFFQPFVTTKTWGTGLGLTISRKICEAHGGRLLAENRLTGGAIFRVLIPVA